MFRSLMSARRFAPLFWCQFFSAFNDNFLKNALGFLILFGIGGQAYAHAGVLVTLASAVFIGPFFILSGLGGQWADRYDKALMARRLKFAEIFAAGTAVLGFLLHSVPVLFVALGLFGTIAALFGPIKYGILPDHLRREELPAGNALVEAATFLAILLGTIAAGAASAMGGSGLVFGALVMGFAVLCWLSARMIPPTGEGAPDLHVDRNVARSTVSLLRDLWADTRLWRGSLTVSWFWLVGVVVLSLLPVLVRDAFNGTETVITVLLALFSIGIAVGSGLASWLASGRIVLLPTPVGAVLMGLFGLDLAWTIGSMPPPPAEAIGPLDFLRSGDGLRTAIGFLGLAVSGGLYIVPSFAAVQAWTEKAMRARIIGAVNVVTAAFMVAGTLALAGLQAMDLSIASLLALVAVLNLVVGVLVFATLPTSPFRDALSILFRAFYRLEVRGLDNVAAAGPNCILALNHVSFLDAPLALSLLDQEPVFAVDSGIAQRWWVRPFLRVTKAMPLDPTRPLATRTLINAVKSGETLIIFPEGRLTVTGSLMKVYDGAGLIADKSGAMVVPVKIDGLERTAFSRLSRSQVRRRWWPKVTVTVLPPVRLTVDPALRGKARRQAAGAALYGIMSDLLFRTADTNRGLMAALIDAGERHGWRRTAVEDPVTGRLTYSRLVTGANVLGRKLMPLAPEGGRIGVMLPNANGAAVTLFALASAGRVPAMINFSAGAANVLSACRAAQVDKILTSRAFIEKGRLGTLVEAIKGTVELVYLEDLRATVTTPDKIRALLAGRKPLVKRLGEDPAAILFTSGSEGTPKGVVLANRCMLANVAQVAARIDFGPTDKVFNVLPVFHAFGLTAGLVLPLVSGVPVYLYPSPLHYRIVPELIYGSNSTVLFGTDTFLSGYARAAHSYDLRSLRYVVAGAEAVKESTRKTWGEKFGLRILEGYGVTECGPVVALNTPMFNRFGTVGRILPGIETRLEPVPGIDEGGRLALRGPNIMLGYLRAEKPGVLEPPPDGWHDTGDIVAIDAMGFVTIKGRAKRFAKIAGEMVSLASIEALAAELWPNQPSAVAAVPDPRKGERLVLFTQEKGATRAAFQSFAKGRGASDVAIPAEVVVLDAIPMLGTGKVDQVSVVKLAQERAKEIAAA
ncbi:acyl-[ACP]--phospholipid O-acyltransferase [Methylobacterium brachiatum]|uniref:Acyl-[acyl-carrier-protein]-phospholipid O-acyltransferase/long-chain-fatty-acid--[acyl-carrier-protein] ligase n=1 Tax=Methylobacterium brachiatum TaxID=269660 RepID=A0AAJ1WW05_9HYPH|nr:acyl-[ACP]--phospholipid O-acyltransferase [Methylobacterium brachiatum]MCB4803900.1 acyl-[ACP]--phospholipid O-acyltransferase [Methylobacterium brachiatum]MDQ0545159.1 acyl-[acyl-carrier-protein]-phospholipid O-acyltransferase/long-chain-fatty-acid--[acyl-carrier-protein] ligase [Methylobacterium brachiatum]SFJ44397.1 acyl-[acyl-carrier-protein]-phospholipid O-acyltransferase / long-chain-fatty-acid--[acyl-carrier-protein] ligase [Methylobacterium brachiatum]